MNYNSLDELSKAILNDRDGLNNMNIVVGDCGIYELGEDILKSIMKHVSYIEDPEYRIYYKNYSKICENIINRSNKVSNTLIITQSLEFIDSFLDVSNNKNVLDNVSIFTCIEKDNQKYIYRKLSGKDALRSREDYCIELRC